MSKPTCTLLFVYRFSRKDPKRNQSRDRPADIPQYKVVADFYYEPNYATYRQASQPEYSF